MHHYLANGLWQFDHDVMTATPGAAPLSDVFTFLVDDDTVTVRLFALSPGARFSDDDIYRLDSRWEGDRLTYLLPDGEWTDLALWHDDHFELVGPDRVRLFKRITPEDVAAWNRDILKPGRPRFDYERTGAAGGGSV